ncbi:MAG: hypothetical protein HQL62_02340 [Magnetococcales bacterium]|nr:hypothetical protein [Magnetococcales bacterium]
MNESGERLRRPSWLAYYLIAPALAWPRGVAGGGGVSLDNKLHPITLRGEWPAKGVISWP